MANKEHQPTPAEQKQIALFAEMMIEKIKSITTDWHKPWFTEAAGTWPKNLSGRAYNGMNATMLLLQSEKQGYQTTRFGTYDSFKRLGFKSGTREPQTDKEGKPLPQIVVNRGEKAFPVALTTFTVVDKETKEHINYDDYKQMSKEEQEKYNVYPHLKIYPVFNIEQTNMKEARPDLWDKFLSEVKGKRPDLSGDKAYSFEPVDKMIKDNEWICPIKPTHGDEAYFSISKNHIVIPEKEQFKDGESFYSNLFHEMAHSTGQKGQLDRLKPTTFGSKDYAREELVAELTAALTANNYGMTKHIKEDSAAYLKSWLNSLNENPSYIKTILKDVDKASHLIRENVDRVAQEIKNGESVETKEKIAESKDETEVVKEESKEELEQEENVSVSKDTSGEEKDDKIYYSSVAYLQSGDDVSRLEELHDDDKYDEILTEAENYLLDEAPNLTETYLAPDHNRNDDILCENDNIAVVYNGSVGGTYEIFEKHTEQEIKDNLIRYGADNVSPDVAKLASPMEEFSQEQDVLRKEEAKESVTESKDETEVVKEDTKEAQKQEIVEEEQQEVDIETPQSYFNNLIKDITDGNHEGHSTLEVESIEELREAYKDHEKVGEWITNASDKEIMDAGASMLPKITEKPMEMNKEDNLLHYQEDGKYYMPIATFRDSVDVAEMEHVLKSETKIGKLTAQGAIKQLDGGENNQSDISKNIGIVNKNDVLYNDDRYIAVKDNQDDSIYVYKSMTKETVLDIVSQDGLSHDAHPDVKDLANEEAARQFNEIKRQPIIEMPSGAVLSMQYNQDTQKIEVGPTTNLGIVPKHNFDFDHQMDVDSQIQGIYEELSEMPEYAMSQDEEVEEKEEKQQEQGVAHEDSNVETNVAGLAQDIAETGVPMQEAEKEANSIVDDKVHEEYHQEQAKQEQEKQAEEQKQEEKKEEQPEQEVTVQASLLLGALAAAKENNGVWMNKDEKANASMLYSHTPITAYNNIMLNLQSDQKGYKTNVYDFHRSVAENGIAVKQGEKSTPFNWVNWDYQNVTDKNDIITRKQYEQLPDDMKGVYEKYASRETQHIFNIDQTTLSSINKELYANTIKTLGANKEESKSVEKPEQKEDKQEHDNSILKQYNDLKKKHPEALLLFRTGDFYETYNDDAKTASDILKLTLTKQDTQVNGENKSIQMAGFPYHALDTYLPKLIRAGQRVAICDSLDAPKKTKVQAPQQTEKSSEAQSIIDNANKTAKAVMAQAGGKYERVMVLQPAMYDKAEDKLVVSGMRDQTVGNERQAAVAKANDIYRAVVAATGTENRLDRSGRNNLLPEDDAKHEKLVQELAAGVLMARQGLPATLSKDSQKLIPYWEREVKENPKLMGVIERDVNNAIETIDNLANKRQVNYESIRNMLPSKMLTMKPQNYSITTDLTKLPSTETKEVVVVKDAKAKSADVILPEGASLEANVEISGMRKDRIQNALKKEGIENVKFYNAGGSHALLQPNEYFQDKEVTVAKMKQYQLLPTKPIDVSEQAKPAPKVEIEKFLALKDDNGRYAFFIKPKDEPSFAVYPNKEHMNKYFNVLNTPQKAETHAALANKWYEIAKDNPSIKKDLITPPKVDVDMSKIEKATITSSAQDKNQKIVVAIVNGKRETAPITREQWNKMWLADDMAQYKKAVAAIAFAPLLKQGVEKAQEKSQTATVTEKPTQKVVEETPAEQKPEQKEEQKVKATNEETHSRGRHM